MEPEGVIEGDFFIGNLIEKELYSPAIEGAFELYVI